MCAEKKDVKKETAQVKKPPPKRPPAVKKAPIHDPIPVNPLIKLTRYGFLIAGILYGAQRHSYLSAQQAEYRKKMQPIWEAREAQLIEEKKQANVKELEQLFESLLPK